MAVLIKKNHYSSTLYHLGHGYRLLFIKNTRLSTSSKFFPEVPPVTSKCAEVTVQAMKTIFSRHGIPTSVNNDNMPFSSKLLKQFAKAWNFSVVTSSPRFPQSNGFAKRNVQTIKSLLKQAKEAGNDEYLALLEFWNTRISGLSESPAQLLMGRHLRSSLPML